MINEEVAEKEREYDEERFEMVVYVAGYDWLSW